MGVSTQVNRQVYQADGVSTAFSFPYYFFAQQDLVVYTYDTVAGVILQKVLNTDFTISGSANAQGVYQNGGTVNFVTAPASTLLVVIVRSPFQKQNYVLAQNGQISSVALVQQFDYLTLLMQRLEDQISRCVQLPDGLGKSFDPVLPDSVALTASAGAYVQINQNANGMTTTPAMPQVQRQQVTYQQLQTAALTNHFSLFSLPAGAMLTMLAIKHDQAFVGASISSIVADLGIATDYSKFMSAFDLAQSVSDSAFDNVFMNFISSWASATQIYLTATAVGANLSALSQGSLTVYYSWVFVA